MSKLLERSIRVAESYLQTAVIVDDQARLGDYFAPPTPLQTPDRRSLAATTVAETEAIAEEVRHNLEAKRLLDAFAERGIVCGVIAPEPGASVTTTAVRAAERADIVLLDWQIEADDGRTALSVITELIRRDAGERLRYIAIFTGEPNLTAIGERIAGVLQNTGTPPDPADERKVMLSVRHTRIAIYSKSGTHLPENLTGQSVSEADLPARVISDFATMTNGLVPAIALTALAALRTNASRILDKCHAGMDAPFLAHRACLPHPDDASRHLAAAIAAEAGCVMESAVFSKDPASMDAIMDWVADSFGVAPVLDFGVGKRLDCEQIRALFVDGYEKQSVLSKSNNRDRFAMTRVISRGGDADDCLDLELAWLMSFRTVYDDSPPPILRLGTVVRKRVTEGDAPLYVCMRPQCDCVRLKGTEHFHFLPLVEPTKDGIQLSVRLAPNTYQRFGVDMKPSQWFLAKFAPITAGSAVTASQDGETDKYCFTASDEPGTCYDWMGELKPEFAQRIASRLASQLSRVAVNNTEWLRRQEGLSD